MFFYSMIFQLKQEMRTLCNKANTLQSRAVVKTIRPLDQKTKRLKDQKTKKLRD